MEAIDRALYRNNHIVVQMPTGLGKNYIAMKELLENCRTKKISCDTYYQPDILIVAHRREWIATIAERLRQHDIRLKEYKSGWYGLNHIYVISAGTDDGLACRIPASGGVCHEGGRDCRR